MNKLSASAIAWLLIAMAADSAWCNSIDESHPASADKPEQPYFEDLPVVLSVTRLRQTLADAPAAVTVIDSDFIRRSGARDVNELFRLVPGFQVGADNGAHPLLYYHGVFDEFPRRLQVLVDGRSVFLPELLGEVDWNAIAIALEDIERIEVIRGSNSASYGDNAFLGMLNIITRHAAMSHGSTVSVNAGGDGIRDGFARAGWGSEGANFRFSMRDQRDQGLALSYDDRHLSLVNFRGDLNPTPGDDIMFSLGASRATAGQGYVGNPTNAAHTQTYASDFAQVNWQHDLGGDGEIRVSAAHVDDDYTELVPSPQNTVFDDSVRSARDTLGAQKTQTLTNEWRVVWGGELERDSVVSRGLSNPGTNYVDRWQAFANAEWRAAHWLIINAGGLEEHDSLSGSRFAPRLMANFRLSDDQTVRLGISKAYRPPSITERTGDFRLWLGNIPVYHEAVGNSNFQAEKLIAREVSYLGDFPSLHLHLDLRAFHEQITGLMRLAGVNVPLIGVTPQVVNGGVVTERGVEYQADWRPFTSTRFLLAQTFLHIDSAYPDEQMAAPTVNTSVGWFQDLPGQFTLSLMRYAWGAMTWQGVHSRLDDQVRTDLRVAHPFKLTGTRGEAAIVVQNLNHAYPEFVPAFLFERRTFATLRFDF